MSMTTRLRDAMNEHDIDAFVDCFHEDYRSEQPIHPGRGFGGRTQVRANWTAIFAGVPDFTAEVVGSCLSGSTEWSEWRWTGTREDGSALHMVGVTVFGIRDDRIAWGRLYVEPVQGAAETIDEAVRGITRSP
jgi:hypothetical protein